MYPFFIFDLGPEATDAEVKARYHELLREYPPDRAPDEFAAIRQAYTALADRRSRLRTWLFYFDEHGRSLLEGRPLRRGARARPRAAAERLAAVVRQRVAP